MITLSSCVVGAGGLEIYAEGCVAEQDLQEQAMEATPLAQFSLGTVLVRAAQDIAASAVCILLQASTGNHRELQHPHAMVSN